jgi:hypothetical protein
MIIKKLISSFFMTRHLMINQKKINKKQQHFRQQNKFNFYLSGRAKKEHLPNKNIINLKYFVNYNSRKYILLHNFFTLN